MKVSELIELLKRRDPDSQVLVRVDGSIYATDNVDEHKDYNQCSNVEYFILAID
jgi:nitrite reductase/ring-hydroxylating ferredoxin subunit